ncbi:hypothetical protein, partial [Leptospira mayottensis]|uniref:hypothetical protein n=1 Tax=Leptospira mayottensis TaxID=1137606 RepID=UPI001AF016FC
CLFVVTECGSNSKAFHQLHATADACSIQRTEDRRLRTDGEGESLPLASYRACYLSNLQMSNCVSKLGISLPLLRAISLVPSPEPGSFTCY